MLSIAVMHHPKRAGLLPGLLARLAGPAPVEVVVDRGLGLMDTANRAWAAYPPASTHHLVLQDDVLPCRDFQAGVLECIKARPESPLGLYANRKEIEEARRVGVNWVVIPDGCWGQATLLPVPLAKEMLEWAARTLTAAYPHDDDRNAMFLLWKKIPVWCTAPSLVEHLAPSNSLIGFSNRTKVARWFIGAETSALTVDWARTTAVQGKQTSFKTYFNKLPARYKVVP